MTNMKSMVQITTIQYDKMQLTLKPNMQQWIWPIKRDTYFQHVLKDRHPCLWTSTNGFYGTINCLAIWWIKNAHNPLWTRPCLERNNPSNMLCHDQSFNTRKTFAPKASMGISCNVCSCHLRLFCASNEWRFMPRCTVRLYWAGDNLG